MLDAIDARTEHEIQSLAMLVDCATTISLALGEAAKAETDKQALIKLSDAFQRGFQGVRLGIRLSHTLRAPPKPGSATELKSAKAETPKVEAAETLQVERAESAERLERLERQDGHIERERDRDYEPVSLSRFLAALGVVARDAERLADRLPAEVAAQTLPALRDLLARTKADPPQALATPAATAVLTRPRPPAVKAALLGSTSAPPTRPIGLRGPNLARPPPRPPR